jgi:hypothetical protein
MFVSAAYLCFNDQIWHQTVIIDTKIDTLIRAVREDYHPELLLLFETVILEKGGRLCASLVA